jgi:glycosyltransferase involved in cell wall biosynthesis
MQNTPIKVTFITSLYRPGDFLESFLELYTQKFNHAEHELVLVHNDPTDQERAVIARFAGDLKHLVHLCVERESVYASWNRAIKASSGEYLAIWNVDDRRSRYGLQQQVMKLDNKPYAMIVSGDYVKVFRYGHTVGTRVNERLRRSPLMGAPRFRNGCFLMWRRSVHEQVGFFDEQFRVAGDREFWYRVTRRFRADMARGTMGFYLRVPGSGLSRTNAGVQMRESALVAWRYAALMVASPWVLPGLRAYRRDEIVNFGEPVAVKGLVKRSFLWFAPSLVLFFLPSLVKLAVEARFALLALRRRGVNKPELTGPAD